MRVIDPAGSYLAGQLSLGKGNSAIRGRDMSPILRSSRRLPQGRLPAARVASPA